MEFKELIKHIGHDIECMYSYFDGDEEAPENMNECVIYCHTCYEDIIIIDSPLLKIDKKSGKQFFKGICIEGEVT